MDSRPTTPEDEAALDRAIDAARDGHASQGDGDGLDEFAARLHGFASSGPALDETRIRRTLEARLDSTPQHQSWLRLPSWLAMNRSFAPAAVAVVVALMIGVGALMSTGGSASAAFLDDVQELSAVTELAIDDGELDIDEFAEISALVAALLDAVSDPEVLAEIEPEALATIVEELAAVQAVLDEHDDGIDGDDGAGGDVGLASDDLGLVSDNLGLVFSAVLQAHASGLIVAAGEACDGEDADQEACKQAFDNARDGCRALPGNDRGSCRSELGGAALGTVGSIVLEEAVLEAADMEAAQKALDDFLKVYDEQTELVGGVLAESGLSALTTDIGDWQASIDAALADALALLVAVPDIDPDSIVTKEDAEALEEQLDALKDDLDEAREALEDAFEPMLDDIDAAIEALDALFAEADDAVEEAAEPFDDDFRVYRDDVKAYIADLHILFDELRDDAHAQRDAVKDAIDAAEAELAEAVDAVKTALDAARDELKLLKEGLVDEEDEDSEGLKADGLDDDESEDDEDEDGESDDDNGKSGENSSGHGRNGEASD